MDGQRFDDMTKALSAAPSRRRLLNGFVGGAAGALAGALGLRHAAATLGARSYGRTCAASFQCRTGFCKVYPNGHGRCLCPDGRSLCRDDLGNETCRDLQCDLDNCGACGNTCTSVACVRGACSVCLDCFMIVGGVCVPDSNAPPNGPCTCGFSLVGGICVPTVCAS